MVGDAEPVADRVGVRRLVGPAERRPLVARSPGRSTRRWRRRRRRRTPGRPRARRRASDAVLDPVGGRDPHRHRPVRGPHLPHRGEHLERVAQPAGDVAAVLVGAPVGHAARGTPTAGSRARSAAPAGRSPASAPRRAASTNWSRISSMLGAGQLARHLVDARAVGHRRRADDLPVALVERLVDALPHQLGRALAAGVAELEADLRRGVGVHEVGDPPPATPAARRPRARRSPGVIRPSGETQTISVITSPAPPRALPPRCTRWKSDGQAVVGDVHVHRRDDDPVDQLERPEPERLEHRRADVAVGAGDARGRRTSRRSGPRTPGRAAAGCRR